jgi:hypothetical protein
MSNSSSLLPESLLSEFRQSERASSAVLRRNCRNLWIGIAVLLVVAAASLQATGLSVDLKAGPAILAQLAIFAGGAWLYSRKRPDARLVNALAGLVQLLLVVVIGAVLTYPAAKAGFPYRDAVLYQLDQWLGFDRAAYLRAFTDQPWKLTLCNSVYLSMLPEMAVIPLVLILARRTERFQRFIAAYGLALVSSLDVGDLCFHAGYWSADLCRFAVAELCGTAKLCPDARCPSDGCDDHDFIAQS